MPALDLLNQSQKEPLQKLVRVGDCPRPSRTRLNIVASKRWKNL